jgi:hypothetical protein
MLSSLKNVKTFKSIVETPSSEEAQKDLSDYMNSPSIETTLGKAGELIVTAGKIDYGIDDDILAEVNEVVSSVFRWLRFDIVVNRSRQTFYSSAIVFLLNTCKQCFQVYLNVRASTTPIRDMFSS